MSQQGPEQDRPSQGWAPPPQQWGPPPGATGQWGPSPYPPAPPSYGPYPSGPYGAGPHAAGSYPPVPYAQAPYAPVSPPGPSDQLPSFPHPEPREYHQMLRTWNYAWWKPVLGTALVLVGMMLVAPLLLVPVLVFGVLAEGGSFWEGLEQALTLEAVGPAALLYINLSLGASILVTWVVMRYVHRMRPRWLTSVVPKMRWKLFFVYVGFSVVALVATIVVGMFMPSSGSVDMTGELNPVTGTTVALALVVLLTTPFQAAGEEYVFRGYLLQAIGSFWSMPSVPPWVARWLAIVITSVIFALGHGVQNFPLFFDRFMFGLIAGWLVVRTGGLEAGIAMHILNNFLAFGYALAFSDLTSSLTATEIGWENIPLTLTQAGVYAGLVLLVARKGNVQRRTAPPAGTGAEAPPDRHAALSPNA